MYYEIEYMYIPTCFLFIGQHKRWSLCYTWSGDFFFDRMHVDEIPDIQQPHCEKEISHSVKVEERHINNSYMFMDIFDL